MAKSATQNATSYFDLSEVDRAVYFRKLKQDAAKRGLPAACESRGIPCMDERGKKYLPQSHPGSYKSIEADQRKLVDADDRPQELRDFAEESLGIRARRTVKKQAARRPEIGDLGKLKSIFGGQTEGQEQEQEQGAA